MSGHEHEEGKFHHLLKGISRLFPGKDSHKRASEHPPDVAEIQEWLVTRLSKRLGLPPDEMDIRQPLAQYGLDSRTALSLSGELEDWLGRELSPTLVWDYPTIEELALHLARPLDGGQSA